MRYSIYCLILLAAFSFPGWSQDKSPMVKSVDKPEALRGDVVTATGTNLGKAVVADVYLTLGGDDVELKVLNQSDTAIRFEIGPNTKFARWALMLLTAGDAPAYIEQPVKVDVVEKLTPKVEEAPAAPAEPPAPEPTPNP